MPRVETDTTHLRIREATDWTAWDAFVQAQPGWTIFHRSAWQLIAREVWRQDPIYLVAERGSSIEGVLPLVHVRSRLFGSFLVSCPFVNYGGPLGSEAAVGSLVERAVSEAASRGVDLLELRCREPRAIDLPVSHHKVTVTLPLESDADAQWKRRVPSKLRSQIRRPTKEGLTFRAGPDQAEPFYSVWSQHMRDLGTPSQGLPLFHAIREALEDEVWFGCVYDGDRPVAGGCGFAWDNEFEMTWAASLREYSRAAPNMLLYWSAMTFAIERGLERFNFGRCTPGSGTHRFKRQWGSEDEPLHWYQLRRGRETTPSPTHGKFRLATRIWQRLPLPITRPLGAWLSRRIP